jgi:hypothetical protein
MRYHLGLGVGHAHLSTYSNRIMSADIQDEPTPELLPISGDVRATDIANDDESDNSEMGLEDREGLNDWESDDSSDGDNSYDQDLDDYDE